MGPRPPDPALLMILLRFSPPHEPGNSCRFPPRPAPNRTSPDALGSATAAFSTTAPHFLACFPTTPLRCCFLSLAARGGGLMRARRSRHGCPQRVRPALPLPRNGATSRATPAPPPA